MSFISSPQEMKKITSRQADLAGFELFCVILPAPVVMEMVPHPNSSWTPASLFSFVSL